MILPVLGLVDFLQSQLSCIGTLVFTCDIWYIFLARVQL